MQRRTFTFLMVICLGHVLLISAQVQSKSGLPLLESVAFDGFSQIQRLMASVAGGGHGVWTNYFALRGAARENEALRQRILALEAQVQEQQALVGRTHGLEAALGFKETQPQPTLAARVIAGNPSPLVYRVTIDRGTSDGLTPDMAIIGSRGVVGRVVAPVASHVATVQLLIDKDAAAAVTFEQSGAGGLVLGDKGDPPLKAGLVPAAADVRVGERVVTSGQDGIYAPGFLIGTVERITGAGAERTIAIRPAVDFSHIDIVLVMLNTPPRPEAATR